LETENHFTMLENSAIGKNIALHRKLRGIKALEVAEKLGLKEAAYTRYERGEGALTINMIQKIAEILKIDPLLLVTSNPISFIDNGHNSPNSIIALNASNCQTSSENQLQLVLKLVESVTALNDKLVTLVEKRIV
jgi:transcriptional regulator with XRE-family HTH domain